MRHFLLGFGHAIERSRCELGRNWDRGLIYVAIIRYSNCLRETECMVEGSHPLPSLGGHQ